VFLCFVCAQGAYLRVLVLAVNGLFYRGSCACELMSFVLNDESLIRASMLAYLVLESVPCRRTTLAMTLHSHSENRFLPERRRCTLRMYLLWMAQMHFMFGCCLVAINLAAGVSGTHTSEFCDRTAPQTPASCMGDPCVCEFFAEG
jgi:hypothetical protein